VPLSTKTDVFAPELDPISNELFRELCEIVDKIAAFGEGKEWLVYGTFKQKFGNASPSSTVSFLQGDCSSAMYSKRGNGPYFVIQYWAALEELSKQGLSNLPGAGHINGLFRKCRFPYEIDRDSLQGCILDTAITESAMPSSQTAGYQLGAEVGRGGFGVVYRATKTTSVANFEFAIKILDPHPFSVDNGARERFRREVLVISKLQHRGVVHYVDAGFDQKERPYFVMQFVEGESLRTFLEHRPHLDRVPLMIEILMAMQYVHSQDVIHRDLKPTNILVRKSDSQPVIIDFGMGYALDILDEHSLTTSAPGSSGYIPPEVQVNPKMRTVQHDIYSCGVILYEILAGSRPNPAKYESLGSVSSDLVIFDPVIQRATEADPTRRYSAMSEFADELKTAYSTTSGR
jgi:serine/threonine protein kinase